MTMTAETVLLSPEDLAMPIPQIELDRRADVNGKHAWVTNLLQEIGCDSLLVLEPEHFTWLTSGGAARGIPDPSGLPGLFYSADQRWVVCSNVDSQRIFDEELNELGFQLKEWPWYWGREQLLTDLVQNKKPACDRAYPGAKPVGPLMRVARRTLSAYDQACYRVLGAIVVHALEATCRTMNPEATEREIAGQLAYRLLHRGAQPLVLEVAADGRSRRYRQCGYTSLPIRRYAVLTITARKYGVCVTASRSLCFGEPDATFKKEHDAACRVSATYLASSWPDALPAQILNTGRHVYRISDFEHEWRLSPQGHLTGRIPVEFPLMPQTEELFKANTAVVWHASAGAAFSCDTFLITETGPELVTPTEMWPLKLIKVQGAEFFRPDVLCR